MPLHIQVDHVGSGLSFDTSSNTLTSTIEQGVLYRTVEFDNETPSPINVGSALTSGDIVIRTIVNVQTAFNGSSPTLSIGVSTDNDAVASGLNIKSVGTTYLNAWHTTTGADQIQAYLVPDGSTTGSGTIIIEVIST